MSDDPRSLSNPNEPGGAPNQPDPWAIPEAGRSDSPPPTGHAPAYPPPGHPPPGYPPPGNPPPGYPPHGYPMQPSPYPPQRGTNGFAIASLVLGIIAIFPLAFIFAIVALVQIRKEGGSGRGLAIAGLVLSILWAAVITVIVIVAVTTAADRDDTGAIVDDGRVFALDIKVGDCLSEIPESDMVTSVDAVPCSEAHRGEVYSIFALPDGDYPGDDEIYRQAEEGCFAELDSVAAQPDKYSVYYMHPIEQGWPRDREVVCIAISPSKTTGSITDGS